MTDGQQPDIPLAKFMLFTEPSDPEVLRAVGVVAIRHGHLDHMLRMTIKTLSEVTAEEALDATVRESASSLRDRIRKLARLRVGEGPPLIKLQALLERAQRATERRNDVIHSVCGRDIGSDTSQLRSDDHSWKPYPTVDELNVLARELTVIAGELNEARLAGFIRVAMDKKKR